MIKGDGVKTSQCVSDVTTVKKLILCNIYIYMLWHTRCIEYMSGLKILLVPLVPQTFSVGDSLTNVISMNIEIKPLEGSTTW